VIGLYELLGNPTTYLIEPPGPSLPLKKVKEEKNKKFKYMKLSK
jgi:hypothetical protein